MKKNCTSVSKGLYMQHKLRVMGKNLPEPSRFNKAVYDLSLIKKIMLRVYNLHDLRCYQLIKPKIMTVHVNALTCGFF